jgi:hypothetical protein
MSSEASRAKRRAKFKRQLFTVAVFLAAATIAWFTTG